MTTLTPENSTRTVPCDSVDTQPVATVSQIQALPTRYNGFLCRSRLEARWMVFFDSIGIEYWYEPEGFRLKSGELYLPDFFLPHIAYWAEVKPFTMTTPEVLKADDLAKESGRPVLALEGPPDFKVYQCIYPNADVYGASEALPVLLDIEYHDRKFYDGERRLFADPIGAFKREDDFSDQYRAAVYKSRAERFGVHE